MAIPNEDETKKIKTSTSVDEAIREANTNPGNTSVTDEDVEQARQSAGASIEQTIDEAGLNQATQMDSKNAGAAGKNVTALFRKISGKTRTINAVGLTRFAPRNANNVTVSVSDADHLDRNTAMAQSAFEQVQSNILREATRGTENGEQTVIGIPADTNVYSEESFVMSETVTGKLAMHPSSSPKTREDGTMRARRSKMLSVSGDYLHASSQEGRGHDAQKGWMEQENLLFNRLDRFGNVIPNQFVAPKRGRFWLKGFNPLGGGGDHNMITYRVKRRINDADVFCNVYQSTANSHGLFEVVDLTPTMDAMHAAIDATAELLTCNKSKFTLGQVELIAQKFAAAQRVVDNPNEVIEWPEFADAQRSTLRAAAGVVPNNANANCLNSFEPFVEFMHYLGESEIVIAGARLNVSGLKDTLKFHRGMEGINPSYPYWRNVFHGDPHEVGVFARPSMAAYAATKSSSRGYDTMAKWIYAFRAFWTDIETYVAVVDDGAAKDYVMSQIRIQKDVVERMHNMLSIGTINDKEQMTSAQTIFGGNSIDLILGFDPNDLVDYEVTGTEANQARIVAWPCAGYANVYTRTTAVNAQTVVYNILPTWMQILLCAVNATPFRQRLLQYHPGGVQVSSDVENPAHFFFGNDNYAQINIDLETPSWFSLYFLEALMCYKERVYSDKNQLSGYLRYLRAEKVFQVDSILADDLVSLKDALDGLITDATIHYDPNANTPAKFESLHDGALKENFDWLGKQQLMIFSQIDAGKLNHPQATEIMVFQPTHFDQHVFNMTGYTAHTSSTTFDGEAGEGHAGLIQTVEDIASTDGIGWKVSPDGDFAILIDGPANSSNPAPVWFTRDVERYDGAKTVEVLQFDADGSFLGFEDNPEKAMYHDDSFVNLQPFDGYVLCYKRGNYTRSTEAAEPNCPAFRNYFFAPYILSKGKTRTTGHFAALSANHSVALLSANGYPMSANAFYDTAGTNPAQITVRTAPAINGAADIMRRPSLYGYERFVPAGFTSLNYGFNRGETPNVAVQSRQQDILQDGATFSASAGSYSELQRTRIYCWRPNRLGYAEGLDVNEARLRYGAQFAIDSNSPSNWEWYSSQNVEVCQWDGFYSDPQVAAEGVMDVDNYVQLLQRGNYVACAALIVNNPLNDQFAAEYPDDSYNGSVQAQFGVHMDFDDAILYADYCERFENKALLGYFSSPLFGPIANAAVNSEITWGYSLDIVRNPATRKRSYRNDTRLYLTDKPVVRLNNNWNSHGLCAPLFYEQFHRS